MQLVQGLRHMYRPQRGIAVVFLIPGQTSLLDHDSNLLPATDLKQPRTGLKIKQDPVCFGQSNTRSMMNLHSKPQVR